MNVKELPELCEDCRTNSQDFDQICENTYECQTCYKIYTVTIE